MYTPSHANALQLMQKGNGQGRVKLQINRLLD